MKSLPIHFYIFISIYQLVQASYFVKFKFKEGTNISLQYAITAIQNSSAGYKINDKLGLHSFINETTDQDEPDTTYFTKKMTIDTFQDGWPTLAQSLKWNFPGLIRVGVKLRIKFEIPYDLYTTTRFQFKIKGLENINTSLIEIMIAQLGSISVISIDSNYNMNVYMTIGNFLSSEQTHSVVIKAEENAFMVRFDDSTLAMVDVPYVTLLENAADALDINVFDPDLRPRMKEIVFTHA